MNSNLTVRLSLSFLAVLLPLLMMAHMPKGSAFLVEWSQINFDMWQGAILISSVAVACLMARHFVRS